MRWQQGKQPQSAGAPARNPDRSRLGRSKCSEKLAQKLRKPCPVAVPCASLILPGNLHAQMDQLKNVLLLFVLQPLTSPLPPALLTSRTLVRQEQQHRTVCLRMRLHRWLSLAAVHGASNKAWRVTCSRGRLAASHQASWLGSP